MKTLEMKEATGELAEVAEQVRSEPVVVTDHGVCHGLSCPSRTRTWRR
jgi:hypothetical protein